jgi:hypothetical protein
MKKITILLTIMLACARFSAADTFTLNDGGGQMFGISNGETYQFVFFSNHLSGIGIGIDSVFGDYPDTSGIQNCLACDPRSGLLSSPLLIDIGFSIDHFGRPFEGFMAFDAVSFASSLAPDDALTMIYKATALMQFTFCNNEVDCNGDVLLWDKSTRWIVTAQFSPNQFIPGTWNFKDATFVPAPAPEPSSLLLMGSGIAIIIIRKSRKIISG